MLLISRCLILMSATCMILAAAGCSREGHLPQQDKQDLSNRRAQVMAEKAASLPLAFDHVQHDAGVLWRGKGRLVVSHPYPFTNRSRNPIRITKNLVACRQCMYVDYPTEAIPPQGKAEARMTVDLDGRPGPFNGHAFLILDGDESNPVDLSLNCFVVEPAVTVPDRLEFGDIVAGTPKSQTLTLRVPLAPQESRAEVLGFVAQKRGVQYSLGSFEDRELPPPPSQWDKDPNRPRFKASQAEISVTINPEEPGKDFADELVIHVKDRAEPLRVNLHARVTHPRLTASPATVHFGPIDAAKGVRRKVVLRSTSGGRPPVEAVIAPKPGEGVRAWLEPNSKDDHETTLWVEAEPGAPQFVKGSVTLKVKDPQFPELVVPYSGYVVK